MPLTRRSFLGVAGASAVHTVLPAGLIPGASGALASSAGGGGELFAVVSKHATWAVFDDPHQAAREAELIRQSGWVVAKPVRCTPKLAQQFQGGNLSGFVELDGWALTSREADKCGLDVLRHARDRQAARRQLLDHHLKKAKRWLDDHDDARQDAWHYAARASDPDFVCCLENIEQVPGDCQAYRCSASLYDALSLCLEGEQPIPQISKLTSFHMLPEEHEDRLRDDVLYRLAATGAGGRRDVVSEMDGHSNLIVAVGKACGWLFGAGNSVEAALEMASGVTPYITDELVAMKASETLAEAVLSNGYEVPGFWKRVRGVARHEVEL